MAPHEWTWTRYPGNPKVDQVIRLPALVAGEKAVLQAEKVPDFAHPEELDKDSGFKDSFDQLTPVRQRGYVLHFTPAKQAQDSQREGIHDR